MILSDEDIEFINWASGVINKGNYPSSQAITDCYNRCFADRLKKPLSNTSCGQCIRQRVFELKQYMDIELKKIEKELQQEVVPTVEKSPNGQ